MTRYGALPTDEGAVEFRVWAPRAEWLEVKVLGPEGRRAPLARREDGTFEGTVRGVGPGADYVYVLDRAKERPDPVSRWQPAGVHGPSRVVEPRAFAWTDAAWRGIPLERYIIYELHVGTFTPEGTFDAAIGRLPHLRDLGVTAVEIMPVGEFPGGRNWGYDGVYPYAPQSTYGGPSGLKRLVDACHREGLAVVMDVVYNHLGPEGNYLGDYGPYFTSKYRTPWGDAINYDDAGSDGVRRYFIENALYWLTEYHVDALRLDAVHGIFDFSARHILRDIAEAFRDGARLAGREAFLIAESDLNDARVISPVESGGHGIDAQWSDDFHHSLHAALTGVGRGYFADFGKMADLRKAILEGFVYDGRRSVFRRRRHGNSSAARPGRQLVVCIQNHDQVANGYGGERLAVAASPAHQKVAAALLFFAPNIPMIFMGEEWGETAPFLYFTSHGDRDLAEAVRRGRREEFAWMGGGPDPQAESTFERSKLDWSKLERPAHAEMLRLYRDLIALRKRTPALADCRKDLARAHVDEDARTIAVDRGEAVLIGDLRRVEASIYVRSEKGLHRR